MNYVGVTEEDCMSSVLSEIATVTRLKIVGS